MSRTVGQILKETRTLKELSLQEVSRGTHIRLQYLQELENDRPELLPSKAQARGFLRLYAAFLDFDPAELLSLMESPPAPAEEMIDLVEEEKEVEPQQVKKEETKTSQKRGEERKPAVGEKKKLFGGKNNEKGAEEIKEESIPEEGKEEGVEKTPPLAALQTSFRDLTGKLREGLKKIKPSAKPEKQKETPKPKKEKRTKKTAVHETAITRSSESVFKEIGSQMQMRREKMGLSLSDVEQFTRLRRIYVQAIEEGRFEDLPSSIQGRGMVANYAHFLEMDHDAVLNLYAEGLETQRKEKLEERWTSRKQKTGGFNIQIPEKMRRLLSPDLLFGSLIVVGLFVFILWGASQIFSSESDTEPTTAPSISEMLQSTTTPTIMEEITESLQTADTTQEAGTVEVTQAATQPATPIATANAAPLQLYIVAQQRAWMRVTVDGEVEFEGRILPGNAYTFSGNERILLLTGNGAALEAYFNQEYLGNLGDMGEVINLDFSAAGLTIPTLTITPTVLPTATPTVTPTPTPTLQVTDEGAGD